MELLTKETPTGSAPVKVKVAVGTKGIVRTLKVLNVPVTNVALLTLVMTGGGETTLRVNVWLASGETPLLAVIVNV